MTDEYTTEGQTTREEYRVKGSRLVATVKRILHEGNIRHIHVLHNGRTVMELPLTVVAIGVLIAPVAAALGVLAALATECTLVVERQA